MPTRHPQHLPKVRPYRRHPPTSHRRHPQLHARRSWTQPRSPALPGNRIPTLRARRSRSLQRSELGLSVHCRICSAGRVAAAELAPNLGQARPAHLNLNQMPSRPDTRGQNTPKAGTKHPADTTPVPKVPSSPPSPGTRTPTGLLTGHRHPQRLPNPLLTRHRATMRPCLLRTRRFPLCKYQMGFPTSTKR